MEQNKDTIIVCGASGDKWYYKGMERLKARLDALGYSNYYFYTAQPNEFTPQQTNYYVKIKAIREALKATGATKVLWMDCSIVPYQRFDWIFEHIEKYGFFAWKTGYNLAQTCNDKVLEFEDMKRDFAEHLHEIATTIIGFDTTASEFWEYWQYLADSGCFEGSRFHDNQSEDERFLFFRQDQSCASLSFYGYNFNSLKDGVFEDMKNIAQYNYDNEVLKPNEYYFLIAGGAGDDLPKLRIDL